jgi:uncharacterized protein
MEKKATVRQKIFGLAKRLVLMLALALVGFYGVFYFAQTGMIFQSERTLTGDPGVHGWDYEDVVLPVGGETTHGWFVPKEGARGVVLFCHGNDGNISTRLGTVRFFRNRGFSVFIFDYGGYGKSTGGPSEKRVNQDVLAAWAYLTEQRQIAPAEIVVWGRSFGGGAACELARHVTPGAVVLESTYLSMADVAFQDYPWFPGGLFVRHRFANKDKVAKISAPLLVIHSRDDDLYPFHHGQGLFERVPEPKQFLEIFGDHYDGPRMSKDIYEKGIAEFLDGVFPKAG